MVYKCCINYTKSYNPLFYEYLYINKKINIFSLYKCINPTLYPCLTIFIVYTGFIQFIQAYKCLYTYTLFA